MLEWTQTLSFSFYLPILVALMNVGLGLMMHLCMSESKFVRRESPRENSLLTPNRCRLASIATVSSSIIS